MKRFLAARQSRAARGLYVVPYQNGPEMARRVYQSCRRINWGRKRT